MCVAIYDPALGIPIGTLTPVERGATGCAGAWEAQFHDPALAHVGKGTGQTRLEEHLGTQRGQPCPERGSKGSHSSAGQSARFALVQRCGATFCATTASERARREPTVTLRVP